MCFIFSFCMIEDAIIFQAETNDSVESGTCSDMNLQFTHTNADMDLCENVYHALRTGGYVQC